MAKILGKTVYVLGAGASAHTGAPLLADFLAQARELPYRAKDISCLDSFERVLTWIEEIKRASYYVKLQLENLEHVFSLADLGHQIGLRGFQLYCSDLRKVIAEVLDHCELERPSQHSKFLDKVYPAFMEHLKELNERRKATTLQGNKPFSADSIITFNYDVFLDHAWATSNIRPPADYIPGETGFPDYALKEGSVSEDYPSLLLKLHGSTNWACCQECPCIDVVRADRLNEYVEPKTGRRSGPLKLRLVKETTRKRPCSKCRKNTHWEPYIVPPTWSKRVEKSPVVPVWKRAVKEVSEAAQLVIIGYSLPPTDTFFQYLLALGAWNNKGLRRVVVVNNDDSEDFRNRYRNVLSGSFSEQGGLVFIPIPFRKFCVKTHDPGSPLMAVVNHDRGTIAQWTREHGCEVQ